jgi:hypothetical protein
VHAIAENRKTMSRRSVDEKITATFNEDGKVESVARGFEENADVVSAIKILRGTSGG